MRKIFSFFLLLCFSIAVSAKTAPHSGFIAAGNLKVHYQTEGHGPALLFIHAGYLDMHCWDNQVAYFSKHHTFIRIDLPRHGQTTGVDTSFQIADVIKTVMDSLHVKKASVAGISLGASSALDFALAYPQRVNKLVLTSPGLSGWSAVMKFDALSMKVFLHGDSIAKTRNHDAITENFTEVWYDGPYRKPTEVPQAGRKYVYNTASVNDINGDTNWPVFDKRGAALRAKQLHMPVLILAGTLDVPFILNASRYLHSQVANSQLHVIKGVAHMIHLEKPLLFRKYVSEFLR